VGILSKYSYWVPHILLMFLYSTNQDMLHHICSTSHMIFAVVGPKLSLCGDSHPCLVKLLPNPCYFYIVDQVAEFYMHGSHAFRNSLYASLNNHCVPCAMPKFNMWWCAGRPTYQDKNQIFAAKFCCMLDPLYFNHLKTNIYLQIKFAPKIESILF